MTRTMWCVDYREHSERSLRSECWVATDEIEEVVTILKAAHPDAEIHSIVKVDKEVLYPPDRGPLGFG